MSQITSRWPAILALMAIGVVASVLPAERSFQILSALLGSLIMFLISLLLHRPDITIDGLSNIAEFSIPPAGGFEVRVKVWGRIVNNSGTGTGSIKRLFLRVTLPEGVTDIPSQVGAYEGRRIEPHGALSNGYLRFRKIVPNYDWRKLGGLDAAVHMEVVGQPNRKFKVCVASNWSGSPVFA